MTDCVVSRPGDGAGGAGSMGLNQLVASTALERAGIKDFRFHDLRHTWASWHRQAGRSCDELKDLGDWKSREMVDRYAKFATENLSVAASRIEMGRARFCHA